MNQTLLHIGVPKTGTTSIQSTLFWSGHNECFRSLTLDTDFGNQLVLGAFAHDLHVRRRFFGATIPANKRDQFRRDSQHYLEQCLTACRHEGSTPILSAEAAWSFSPEDFDRMKATLSRHGFTTRIVCYLRAPLDLIESGFAQKVKIGDPTSQTLPANVNFRFADKVRRLDEVFGRDQVSLCLFSPTDFPDRCVVQHFCRLVGIPVEKSQVIRDNDSLNQNAIKFLYAANTYDHGSFGTLWTRLKRRVLREALRDLPGPPLRFHPSITAGVVTEMSEDRSWLEERLGRSIPDTLVTRDPDEGIRSQTDLLDFTPESLEWLAEKTGKRVIKSNQGAATVEQVVKQLQQLRRSRYLVLAAKVAWEQAAIRHQRYRMMRWLRKGH